MLDVGFGANDFQNIDALSKSRVCWLYQSVAVSIAAGLAAFGPGVNTRTSSTFTKNIESDVIDPNLVP